MSGESDDEEITCDEVSTKRKVNYSKADLLSIFLFSFRLVNLEIARFEGFLIRSLDDSGRMKSRDIKRQRQTEREGGEGGGREEGQRSLMAE